METELSLEGVHCAACVWLLERLPRMRDGAIEARVDLRRRRLTLIWDATSTKLSELASIPALPRVHAAPGAGRGRGARAPARGPPVS